jgi:hypothetical protein
MAKRDNPKPMTVSVPAAGVMLGIGRNQAYEAAARGDIPTLRFGKRIVVPLAALERMLSTGERVAGKAA